MNEIIQYFAENCINRFVEAQREFYKRPENFAEFEMATKSIVLDLGKEFIRMVLEDINHQLITSKKRKEKWYIEAHDHKQLITMLGTVGYRKTLFTSKEEKTEDGKELMCYLLDKAVGFSENQHISEGAIAKVYEEAVQTSYRKGGEAVSDEDAVSKQTVKEILHKTQFPANFKAPKQKKTVDYLYIDADEDHYSLQFQEKKGDIETDSRGHKKNGAITKLIYVYEGVEREAPKSKRHRLINPHYFCRGECDNNALWDEVYAYIEANYDVENIKQIYLNSDGGGWIKAGYKRLHGIEYVLDEFHMSKYLLKMTSHMLDSQEDARKELCRIIKSETKEKFQEMTERLTEYTESESVKEKIRTSADYILNNWSAAKKRLWRREGVVACSAEGHVSHVLSSRMSTLAMGWSKKGAGKMAQLREYYYNGGDMLELVKYQKTVVQKAAGAETLELSAYDILKTEINHRNKSMQETAKYHDIITHQLSLQNRKQLVFQLNHYL